MPRITYSHRAGRVINVSQRLKPTRQQCVYDVAMATNQDCGRKPVFGSREEMKSSPLSLSIMAVGSHKLVQMRADRAAMEPLQAGAG